MQPFQQPTPAEHQITDRLDQINGALRDLNETVDRLFFMLAERLPNPSDD